MDESINTICPHCDHAFTTDDIEGVLCPECEWVFDINEDGTVTDADPEHERDPPWEVNDEGQLIEGEPPLVCCPRCSAVVELAEVGAVEERCCHCCERFAVNRPEPRAEDLPGDDEEAYRELGEVVCPFCGPADDQEGGSTSYTALRSDSRLTLVRCECGWTFEVPFLVEPDEWEPAIASDEEEGGQREWRTVMVSPCGSHDHTSIHEAISSAGGPTRILVRPGLYEETFSLWEQAEVEIIGAGAPEDVIVASRWGGFYSRAGWAVLRNLTIRGTANATLERDAIQVSAGRLVLEDCRVSATAGACVSACEQGEVVLRRCLLRGGSRGVHVTEQARAILEDCALLASVGAGVDFEGRALTMRRCRIRGGQGEGVRVAAGHSNFATIENCDITDNKGTGVTVAGGRGLLRDCRVSGSGGAGVRLSEGGACSLEDCELSGSAGPNLAVGAGCHCVARRCQIHHGRAGGIHVRGAALLDHCVIRASGGVGVAVRGGRVALQGCWVRDGRAGGLCLRGGVLRMDDGRVVHNARAGIVLGAGGEFLLRHCRIADSGRAGLVVRGDALGTIEQCQSIGNGGPGVVLTEGANPVLRNCLVTGQANHSGVVVRAGAAGLFEGCVIVGNDRAGVEARRGGRPHLRRCRVQRNGCAGLWVQTRGGVLLEDCDLSDNVGSEMEVEAGCRVHRGPALQDSLIPTITRLNQ